MDCGSSDAFSWNDEGYGFCQSCKTPYPSSEPMYDWAKDRYPTREKRMNLKNWFPDLTAVAKWTQKGIRGIDEDVAKTYGLIRHFDTEGNWLQDGFKYPDNVKYRSPTPEGEKKVCKWGTIGGETKDLFGPAFTPGASKRLYITEGEYDAPSLYQILGKTWPCKSMPSSSINRKFLEHNYKELDAYESIVYAGELDDPGREAADLWYSVFPHKLQYVPLTKHKDANAYLNSPDKDELKWAALKPQKYSPPNFVTGDDEWLDALRNEKPYRTIRVGHSGIDRATRGLVCGGVTLWKAKRGTGKTEIFRYLEHKLRYSKEKPIFAPIHMEEMRSTAMRCWATYELGANVRTEEDVEKSDYTPEEVEQAALGFKDSDRVVLFELLSGDDALKLLKYIRMAHTVYGADFIFVDHLQRLIYRGGTESATSILTQLASQMADLGKDLNISINCISHINKEGGTEYAAALENEAIIVWEVERDMDAEDLIEQDTTYIRTSKNRPFSYIGSGGSFYYDKETTILEEN